MADISEFVKRLFGSQKWTDIELKCEGATIRGHRAVICGRSSFIEKLAEFEAWKSIGGPIVLEGDSLDVVQALICFLYTDDYDESGTSNMAGSGDIDVASNHPIGNQVSTREDSLIFNVKMYAAGEKFQVPSLKQLAARKFDSVAHMHWKSRAFPEAIRLLWDKTEETDREMRHVVAKVAYSHLETLVQRHDFACLLQESGSFSFDIIKLTHGLSLDWKPELPAEETMKQNVESVVSQDNEQCQAEELGKEPLDSQRYSEVEAASRPSMCKHLKTRAKCVKCKRIKEKKVAAEVETVLDEEPRKEAEVGT